MTPKLLLVVCNVPVELCEQIRTKLGLAFLDVTNNILKVKTGCQIVLYHIILVKTDRNLKKKQLKSRF